MRIKQSLLCLHLHVCVCVWERAAGVCRVTQSARRCLSLSTTDRHAGPPGGKMGLQLSVPLWRAERQASYTHTHTSCRGDNRADRKMIIDYVLKLSALNLMTSLWGFFFFASDCELFWVSCQSLWITARPCVSPTCFNSFQKNHRASIHHRHS